MNWANQDIQRSIIPMLLLQCCPISLPTTPAIAHHPFDGIPHLNNVSLKSLLTSPNSTKSLIHQIHAQALKLQLLSDPYFTTSLMESYFRFENADAASKIFTHSQDNNTSNPITWTLLSTLYLKESKPNSAIQLFYRMLASGTEIDSVALITTVKACTRLRSVHDGRKIYEIAISRGFGNDVAVNNSVVKMYLECGRIDEARSVFNGMSSKDPVSWTTMISGCVKNGQFNEGLKLFREMCGKGSRPDSFAVSSVLPACARMTGFKNGKEIHAHIVRLGLGMNLALENALMDMYVKSGSIEYASEIFNRMASRDAISWTVMMLGYSLHGRGEAAIELFEAMEGSSDKTLDLSALRACYTACSVEKGKRFFSRISEPGTEHFVLTAGIMARAGFFIEARIFLEEHKLARNPVACRMLLDGCRNHRNLRLGKRVAEQLVELEPLNVDNYVMLSNFYASVGKWGMVKEMKETIRDMGLKAKKAYSWIEMRNKVHVFGTGDVSHPRSEGIYWEVERLTKEMMEEHGYVTREDFSLHDVDEERECIPSGHSEMLAIGFGLIGTKGVVRVTKNARVCRDCHEAAKMISSIMGREIVVKDPDRFHHLKNGVCSCEDMW